MSIDSILEVLNKCFLNYEVRHTNDYSEVIIPTNNDFRDTIVLFDCGSRKVFAIETEDNEEE